MTLKNSCAQTMARNVRFLLYLRVLSFCQSASVTTSSIITHQLARS
jgi:uncharacterized membrane protein